MLKNQLTQLFFVLLLATAYGCTVDSSDPIDSTDAADATDASDATDATDASDATDATDATDSTDASDATDATDASDATDATDATDAADTSDASDATDPADCGDPLIVETALPDDPSVQDLTLRLECWDTETGVPTAAAYTDQYNNYEWQEMSDIAMEAVDEDKPWASYKLVGTMAEDGSRRIFFFSDPTADSGKIQLLVLSPDFSELWADTGIRTWGEVEDPTDAADPTDPTDPPPPCDDEDSIVRETPLPGDVETQDITYL